MDNEQQELPGMMELAIATERGEWPHTMDAQRWTEEWLRRVEKDPSIATDPGVMVGWFANAIMAGYDRATLLHINETRSE